ncbi:MAG: IS200/IS605 family transposase [Anaerolineae bacterium]|nr:IS200/IS605 family transposase [Anaerolineae bacterium]
MPYSRLFYHFVWTTKRRIPFITQSNRTYIYDAISAKVDELAGMVFALNGMDEHVHLVVNVPAKIAVVDFVRFVKGASSHVASRVTTEYEPFAWQAEYGVLTISESHLPTVVQYVELQQQHHALNTLDKRLEFGNGDV